MHDVNPAQKKLQCEGRIFGVLAGFAAFIAVASVVAEVLSVAAPLWKAGDTSSTLIDIAIQVILSVPVALYVMGLIRARRIFRRIGRGDIFSRDNSQGLVAVGLALLVGAMWSLAAAGLGPAHHQELRAIGFAGADVALSALGLALVMIGRVMNAATDIKTENDRFV